MAGAADLSAVDWGALLERIPADMDELVDVWIRDDVEARRTGGDRDADRPDFWAWKAADHLARRHPTEVLAFILAVLSRPITDETRFSLAAGPLEDVLVRNGPQVIAEVERLSKKQPAFREALGGVWQNAIPDDIWRRVRRARGDMNVV